MTLPLTAGLDPPLITLGTPRSTRKSVSLIGTLQILKQPSSDILFLLLSSNVIEYSQAFDNTFVQKSFIGPLSTF